MTRCFRCGKKIGSLETRYNFHSVGAGEWCLDCAACVVCGRSPTGLLDDGYFLCDGKPYCSKHYKQEVAQSAPCSVCGRQIDREKENSAKMDGNVLCWDCYGQKVGPKQLLVGLRAMMAGEKEGSKTWKSVDKAIKIMEGL